MLFFFHTHFPLVQLGTYALTHSLLNPSFKDNNNALSNYRCFPVVFGCSASHCERDQRSPLSPNEPSIWQRGRSGGVPRRLPKRFDRSRSEFPFPFLVAIIIDRINWAIFFFPFLINSHARPVLTGSPVSATPSLGVLTGTACPVRRLLSAFLSMIWSRH